MHSLYLYNDTYENYDGIYYTDACACVRAYTIVCVVVIRTFRNDDIGKNTCDFLKKI